MLKYEETKTMFLKIPIIAIYDFTTQYPYFYSKRKQEVVFKKTNIA